MRRTWLSADVRTAVALFVIGTAVGTIYVGACGGEMFLQEKYGPAAMLACGRGFINPDTAQLPELDDFLWQRTDAFSPDTLPDEVPVLSQFDPLQLLHLYLELAVALVWWIFGISWSALAPLFGVLYGLTAALAYGVFRLGMKRPLAVFCALFFLTAPLHLGHLTWLRDYSKAPAFMAVFLILGHLVKRPLRTRRFLLLSCACGAAIGFGLGFRGDIIVAAPVCVAAVLVFAPGNPVREWAKRLGAVACMVVCFAATSFPLFVVQSGIGECNADIIYHGTMHQCHQRLGVGGTPYASGGPYSDNLVRAIIQNYGGRVLEYETVPDWYTPEYADIGTVFLRDMVRTFPADFVTRAWAAVWRIADSAHPPRHAPGPGGVTSPFLIFLYRIHLAVAVCVLAYSRYQIMAAVALIGGRNLRQGLFVAFAVLFFMGVASLQFNYRHYFHLAIIPLWAFGFLAQRVVDGVRALWIRRSGGADQAAPPPLCIRRLWRPVARVGCIALVVALGYAVPLKAVRWVQQDTVGELLRAFAAAELEALPRVFTTLPEERVRVHAEGFADLAAVPAARANWPSHVSVLVAEFDNPDRSVPFTVRYTSSIPGRDWPGNNLTWWLTAPPSGGGEGRTRLFIPVYYADWSTFDGLEFAADDVPLLTGLYRFEDEAKLPSILPFVTLPPGWETLPRYITMQ
ncbi:MAG: hypothetical protein GWP08_03500 [Nitrospiraceae bacterium]|nr:hypothetical protein [Nitrospiraceae bacterium]